MDALLFPSFALPWGEERARTLLILVTEGFSDCPESAEARRREGLGLGS